MEIKLFILSYALNNAKMINSFCKISKGEKGIPQEHIFQVSPRDPRFIKN